MKLIRGNHVTITVRFHRLAVREYLDAFDKYLQISSKLAASFKDKLQDAVAKIAEHPDRWPKLGCSFRWVRTRRFPYVLYYQVHEGYAEVLAASHSRRRFGYWKKRRYN